MAQKFLLSLFYREFRALSNALRGHDLRFAFSGVVCLYVIFVCPICVCPSAYRDACPERSIRFADAIENGTSCPFVFHYSFFTIHHSLDFLGAVAYEKPPRGVYCECWVSHAAALRRKSAAGTARRGLPATIHDSLYGHAGRFRCLFLILCPTFNLAGRGARMREGQPKKEGSRRCAPVSPLS